MVTPSPQYREAETLHGKARAQLGAAAAAERDAFQDLRSRIARHGPAHPEVEAARRKWRAARTSKTLAAAELLAADESLEASLQRWAADEARRYVHEGCHG